MKQNELFEVEKLKTESSHTWYVSYALAGYSRFSAGRWGRRMSDKDSREAYLEEHGATLFFYDKSSSPRELFAKVQKIPLVAGLFRNKYWMTFTNDAVFIDDAPLVGAMHNSKLKGKNPTHFGLVNGAHAFFWRADELSRQCAQLEQFDDCDSCRQAKVLGICAQVNVARWARKNDVFVGLVRFEGARSDILYDVEDLDRTLRAQVRSPGLKFASPGIIAGPFECKLMYLNEINLNFLERDIARAKERRLEAQETRRAVIRCESECFLQSKCGLCEKPYYGNPLKCQTGKSYFHKVPGPYTEHEIVESMRREIASRNPRPRKEVAYIAAVSGSSTNIFGYELLVRKMDRNLQNVEFIHERSGTVYTYSYEDALEIITAKYYTGNGYGYDGISLRPEKVAPMSDEAYLIYAELCQTDDAQVSRGWGSGSQPVTYISWDERYEGKYFDVGVRLNYGDRISDLRSAGAFGSGWACFPSLMTDTHLRALREEADQETNPDKPL